MIRNLFEDIYLFKDAVNVYIIKKDNRAVLIDFGSGDILNHLSELQIDTIDYILHTHYHRDQCFGDSLATQQGIKIGVPSKEKKLFSAAKKFWETKSYYDLYYFKPTFFVSTNNIHYDMKFKHGNVFKWDSIIFKIIKTPGHTTGSISYLLDKNGQKFAFTGDLIHSGGKVLTYYDLEYVYNDNGEEGFKYSLKSFQRLLEMEPDVLLPSHGSLILEPQKEIVSLKKKLKKARFTFCSEFSGIYIDLPELNERAIQPIDIKKEFPHLIRNGLCPPILIKGNNDNAILLDFAGDDSSGYYLEDFKGILKKNEINQIDFILPTHYHDDHTAGIPLLLQAFKTNVYALENMVDILENPTHYRLGCLTDQPIKVDRILKDGEEFFWEDYKFQIFHFPGQTEYHAGIFTNIDGKSIFFTGDTITQRSFIDRDTNMNCLNFCRLGPDVGFMKCADLLLKCNPEYLAISHYGIIKINRSLLLRFKEFVSEYEPLLSDLIAQENPNYGFDPNWISFKPIRVSIKPGESFITHLVVRNYSNYESILKFKLNLPKSWSAKPSKASLLIKPNKFKEIPLKINVPKNSKSMGRQIITANIHWNDSYLGPFPDLMVDCNYVPISSWNAWHPDNEMNLESWIYNSMRSSRRNFK